MIATVTGLDDTYSEAETTVRDLKRANIQDADIAMLSNNSDESMEASDGAATGAGAGAALGGVVGAGAGVLAGLGILAIPGVGPVVAAGWLAVTAVGAIMEHHGRIDGVARERMYREVGWTSFDQYGPPYTAAEVARDRAAQGAKTGV